MKLKKIKPNCLFLLTILLTLVSCESNSQVESERKKYTNNRVEDLVCEEFPRNNIRAELQRKIKNSEPLFVHIFVPLCDNKNQGIVPTGNSLGDGLNLRTNLYWGAGYGIKTHFKRCKDWKLIKDTIYKSGNILERVIFVKKFPNKAKVYLIADGYRGDKMKECIEDYLNSLAGIYKEKIKVSSKTVMLNGNCDFLIFNGHNGLMDAYSEITKTVDKKERDAAVIACISKDYFLDYFMCSRSYPLVTTTSLLPPEAYVAEGVINSWANMKTDEEIRRSAGDAMARVHKKSQKAMRRMFATGWSLK